MPAILPSYRIYPLGDAALTIDFGNRIDPQINELIIARFRNWQQVPLPGMTDLVPAYCSLTLHYDLLVIKKMAGKDLTAFDWMKMQVEKRLLEPVKCNGGNQRLLRIPVCYEDEFAPDIEMLANTRNISREEVIREHTAITYRVYMLGFLPGFAYMGTVSDKIATARKMQPQNTIEGSVGIAGRQTGIYPMTSPGGWQIIGRTPLRIFDREKSEPALFGPGDAVQFYPVSSEQFRELFRESNNS